MASGVAAIGECMLELSGQVGDRWRLGYAGDTFNTLYALRALTHQARPADYVSAFGDDPFSAEQITFFAKNMIGVAASPIIPGARPGLYAISLDGAERSFTYWRNDAAARRLADDPAVLEESLRDRELVYFSGITLAILGTDARKTLVDALGKARNAGARIAFDPNYRPRLWPDIATAQSAMKDALAVVDIALPTFPDEAALYSDVSPEDTAKRMAMAGVSEIVVKDGEAPCFIAQGDQTRYVAATSVPSPVDTTGAGDSFNGAYLASRIQGDAPHSAAIRAHRVAGTVIQVKGALAPFAELKRAFDHPD